MIIHGLPWIYDHGCRCQPCRDAKARYYRSLVRKRMARRELIDGRLVAPVPAERHGKSVTYRNHGCRCVPCTVANRDAMTALRERRR